jgi:hypothetical protein
MHAACDHSDPEEAGSQNEISGLSIWVSKVEQVTGRDRVGVAQRLLQRSPDPLAREHDGARAIRLLCNDVNCKYLPEDPHSRGAERSGADAIVRVDTESRPKEVKAAGRVC